MTTPLVTSYAWSPDKGGGLVRDMRVRWALEEVGQPFDVRYLSWGEQKQPAHRACNPFGQVPTYEEDGLVLFESGAIVLHIAETRPGLLPADPAGRARAIEWMFASHVILSRCGSSAASISGVSLGSSIQASGKASITRR